MRNALWFVQALGLAVSFLLFISGSVGWALIYVIVGAAAASAVCCVLSRGNISLEVTNLSGAVQNGAQAQVKITAKKTGFCFAPYVTVYFEKQKLLLDLHLLFSRECSRVLSIPMQDSGLCELNPSHIWISGFFGVLRLPPKEKTAQKGAVVPVLPAYIPYEGEELRPKMLPSEDEDAEETVAAQTNGLLGCEHRPYCGGDSLRSINYKLSAKRGELMVRLCETSGTAPTVVFIAPTGQARCADVAFAIARELVSHGGSVRVVHGAGNFRAGSPQSLLQLREWLSQERFSAQGGNVSSAYPAAKPDVVIDLDGEVKFCAQ